MTYLADANNTVDNALRCLARHKPASPKPNLSLDNLDLNPSLNDQDPPLDDQVLVSSDDPNIFPDNPDLFPSPKTKLAELSVKLAQLSPQLSASRKHLWLRQEAFLVAYAEAGTIQAAAAAIGVHRQTPEYWIKNDCLDFRERFTVSQHAWRENLEDMALERVRNPQGNRGSDVLLITMMNAAWPEKYRPNPPMTDDHAKELVAELRRIQQARRAEAVETIIEAESRPAEDRKDKPG